MICIHQKTLVLINVGLYLVILQAIIRRIICCLRSYEAAINDDTQFNFLINYIFICIVLALVIQLQVTAVLLSPDLKGSRCRRMQYNLPISFHKRQSRANNSLYTGYLCSGSCDLHALFMALYSISIKVTVSLEPASY